VPAAQAKPQGPRSTAAQKGHAGVLKLGLDGRPHDRSDRQPGTRWPRAGQQSRRHPEATGGAEQPIGLPSGSYTRRWQRPRWAIQAPT
jgi:hypothetical protein